MNWFSTNSSLRKEVAQLRRVVEAQRLTIASLEGRLSTVRAANQELIRKLPTPVRAPSQTVGMRPLKTTTPPTPKAVKKTAPKPYTPPARTPYRYENDPTPQAAPSSSTSDPFFGALAGYALGSLSHNSSEGNSCRFKSGGGGDFGGGGASSSWDSSSSDSSSSSSDSSSSSSESD